MNRFVCFWAAFCVTVVQRAVSRPFSAVASQRRVKREYSLPFHNPYPGRDASDLSPMFPFVFDYNMGLQTNTGGAFRRGNLNVPIPGWGIWDLKGELVNGPNTQNWGYGFLTNPANPLKLNAAATQELLADPAFAAARDGTAAVPVIELPSGGRPLTCKPPFCNPFVQTVSSDFLRGAGAATLDGALDFPIPVGANGLGVRFPLDGGIAVGGPPANVNFGHHLGPIDPLAADQKRIENEEVRDRKQLLRQWQREQTELNRLNNRVRQQQQQQRPRPRPASWYPQQASQAQPTNLKTLPSVPDLPDFATAFSS